MRPVFTSNARIAILAALTLIGAGSRRALAQSSPTVTSIVFNPALVRAGDTATAIVTLDQPAPADTTVWLSTSSTTVAPVPLSIVVPAGQTSTSFSFTTGIVATPVTVTVTGNALDTASASGTLTVKVTSQGVTWYLQNVTFSDGSTASGYFTYDANSGSYIDVNITTTQAQGSYFPNTTPLFSYPYPVPQNYNTTLRKQTPTVLVATSYFLDPGLRGQQVDVLGLVFSQPLTNNGGTVPLVVNPNAPFKPICTYDITCQYPPNDISQEYYSMPTSEPPGHWFRIITGGSVSSQARARTVAVPAVWRPLDGTWYIFSAASANGAPLYQGWGENGDIPVPGDFDGDGQTDFAVWRPSEGNWYVIASSNPGLPFAQQWGLTGDVPAPGDFDGDGKADFAVWRPSEGNWYVNPSSNTGAPSIRQWGINGDVPVAADFDGDGKTDFAVWRPSEGNWYVIPSSNPGSPIIRQWGSAGDVPVTADFDGDGKADFAVWRPSEGNWYVIPSSNPGLPIVQQWGVTGDVPVAADFDGDAKADFAVWRPSEGVWYVLPSTNPGSPYLQQWGISGDVPLTRSPGN